MLNKEYDVDFLAELTVSLASRLLELSRANTFADALPDGLADDYVVGEVSSSTAIGLELLCALGLVDGVGVNRMVDGRSQNIFDVNMRDWNSEKWGGWPNFVRIHNEDEIRMAFGNGIPEYQNNMVTDLKGDLFFAWFKNVFNSDWLPATRYEISVSRLPFVPPARYLKLVQELERNGHVYQINNEYFWSQETRPYI